MVSVVALECRNVSYVRVLKGSTITVLSVVLVALECRNVSYLVM